MKYSVDITKILQDFADKLYPLFAKEEELTEIRTELNNKINKPVKLEADTNMDNVTSGVYYGFGDHSGMTNLPEGISDNETFYVFVIAEDNSHLTQVVTDLTKSWKRESNSSNFTEWEEILKNTDTYDKLLLNGVSYKIGMPIVPGMLVTALPYPEGNSDVPEVAFARATGSIVHDYLIPVQRNPSCKEDGNYYYEIIYTEGLVIYNPSDNSSVNEGDAVSPDSLYTCGEVSTEYLFDSSDFNVGDNIYLYGEFQEGGMMEVLDVTNGINSVSSGDDIQYADVKNKCYLLIGQLTSQTTMYLYPKVRYFINNNGEPKELTTADVLTFSQDDLATIAYTGSYYDLINKPTLSNVAYSGVYNDIINRITKTSQLENDSNFIAQIDKTSAYSNTWNDYYFAKLQLERNKKSGWYFKYFVSVHSIGINNDNGFPATASATISLYGNGTSILGYEIYDNNPTSGTYNSYISSHLFSLANSVASPHLIGIHRDNKSSVAVYVKVLESVNCDVELIENTVSPGASDYTTTTVIAKQNGYTCSWETDGTSVSIINNLTSTSTTDALSAAQGKVLNDALSNKMDKVTLAAVATSGSYNDLSDTPEIPSITGLASTGYVDQKIADLVNSAPETLNTLGEIATALTDHTDAAAALVEQLGTKANDSDLHAVAKSGDYNDLVNKPTIPSLTGYATESWVEGKKYLTEHQDISGKQDSLTEVQLSAVNSGITLDKVSTYDGYATTLSNKMDKVTLATVATSGSYNDLSDAPTIPTAVVVENSLTSTSTTNALSAAQGKALADQIGDISTALTAIIG